MMTKAAKQILAKILEANTIGIISHRNPDADAIGSNLALKYFLMSLKKSAVSICVNEFPAECDFLPLCKNETDADFNNFDLIITVDCGSSGQTVFIAQNPEIKNQTFIINIDHHATNDNFGHINLVLPDYASTTLIVYELFKEWKVNLNPLFSTALLYGLYFDTGSFMHSNSDQKSFDAAAELLSHGAKHATIVKRLFKNQPIEKLKLWGEILERAQITKDGAVVSFAKTEDFIGTKASDTSGAIDYLNMLKGSKYAALIAEDGKGQIKGSLRTKEDNVDVAHIAAQLGGGGHKKAAGFTIAGKIKAETKISIEPEDKSMIKS